MFDRQPCKDHLEGICTKSLCYYWHLPECQFFLSRAVSSAKSARLHTGRLKVNQAKSRKRVVTIVEWLFSKMYDSWVAYFRTQSRRNLYRFYGRAQESLGPIRQVRFTKATQHTQENKGPSLGKSQIKAPQRSPYGPKFEDPSQEEIDRQERCARGDAWRLAKKILKLKETDKATFFCPTNERCLFAPPVIKPEGREFVVDSGASMHMLSRKDLNSAELRKP